MSIERRVRVGGLSCVLAAFPLGLSSPTGALASSQVAGMSVARAAAVPGTISTVAGGVGGPGPATQAKLGMDIGTVPVDPAGNLVLADSIDNRIRVVAG